MPSLGSICYIYVDEDGRIIKTENDLFLVSGNTRGALLRVYVNSLIGNNIVGYAAFKRADGYVLNNRRMELLHKQQLKDDPDPRPNNPYMPTEYYVFDFEFIDHPRLLDIPGSLEVSFNFKTAETNRNVATISTVLLVRKNVQPNLETTTEEEFYAEAIALVEATQAQINNHIVNYKNPHKVRADQVPLSESDSTKVATKISEIDDKLEALEKGQAPIENKVDKINIKGVYVFDGTNQTYIPYTAMDTPYSIAQRNAYGNISVNLVPTDVSHATSKKYVDDKAKALEEGLTNIDLSGAIQTNKNYTDVEVQKAKTELANDIVKAEQNAKSYADTRKTEANNYTDEKVFGVAAEANEYTDSEINKVNVNVEEKFEDLEARLPNEIKETAISKDFVANYPNKDTVTGTEKLIIEEPDKSIKYTHSQTLIDKIKREVISDQARTLVLVFNNKTALINALEVSYDSSTLKNTLVSITSTSGEVYSGNELPLGTTIYLKDSSVPDYWLGTKELLGQISDSADYINFFYEIDGSGKNGGNGNVNLDNYYTIPQMDALLEPLATEEQITFTKSLGTTQALGGIAKGTNLSGKTSKEILDLLLFPYVAFSVSMSTNASGGEKEVGTSYTVSTATVNITMGSATISSIIIKRGSTVLLTKTSGIVAGSNTITLPTAQTVDETVTFSCTVTDSEGTSKSANATAFTFVYPYYYGAINNGVTLTEALVKGLTKSVSSKGTKTVTITMNQQNALFAYPKSYGTIKTIFDANGFNVTDTFVKNELTMYDTTYYVYVLSQPATASMAYTFSY